MEQCAKHSKEFPIRCLHHCERGACSTPLSPLDLETVLPHAVLERLFEVSFRQHVRSHPALFRYCPIPSCSRLNLLEQPSYTTANPYFTTTIITNTIITCDGCKVPFCVSCNGPAHPSRTCEQAGNNASLDEWKRKNAVKDCPKCGVPTMKNYGCNHLQCAACMIHFCWVCLAYFKTTEAICEHLQQVHGDWGMEDPDGLPLPAEILVRVARRSNVSYPDLLDRWDAAIVQLPMAPDAQQQSDVRHNEDAPETQARPTPRDRSAERQTLPDHSHPDFAFQYLLINGFTELMKYAYMWPDPVATTITYVRNISEFILRQPEVATRALLDNVSRLEDIEEAMRARIRDGVGMRLRVTLDQFYTNGFYELLFERLVEEERRMMAMDQAEQAAVDMLLEDSGEDGV